MKKYLISLFIALFMTLILTGCPKDLSNKITIIAPDELYMSSVDTATITVRNVNTLKNAMNITAKNLPEGVTSTVCYIIPQLQGCLLTLTSHNAKNGSYFIQISGKNTNTINTALIVNNTPKDLISLFPIEDYDQTISDFIKPTSPDYDQPLLNTSQQKQRMKQFYSHYFSSTGTDPSPWNSAYINLFYSEAPPNDLKSIEVSIIDWISNEGKPPAKIGYGANFRPHTKEWIDDIQKNMDLDQFIGSRYTAENRGIAVSNLEGRALPIDDPHFYSYQLPGQGYPFDNLQETAVWAGTPVYIAGISSDGKWYLVITPNVLVWVHSSGVAYSSADFISTWQNLSESHLVAITKTKTPVFDKHNHLQFLGYVGSIFPAKMNNNKIEVLIPKKDENDMALINTAVIDIDSIATMPFLATPHHFADLIRTMQGRAYGWGNYNFYNDCSAETKNLMTPFAIYLQRHSSGQMEGGKMVDESLASMPERIKYLAENGHKLLTIIYIGGHVFLYIGNNDYGIPITYQNIWGLTPADGSRRAVIGESVLFPLLERYKEDPSLISLANKKYFQVSYLNQMSTAIYNTTTINNLRDIELPEVMLESKN